MTPTIKLPHGDRKIEVPAPRFKIGDRLGMPEKVAGRDICPVVVVEGIDEPFLGYGRNANPWIYRVHELERDVRLPVSEGHLRRLP